AAARQGRRACSEWVCANTLTPKTSVRVSVNFCDRFFDASDLRQRLIPMPLKVLPLPIQLPNLLGLNVGCLGNRSLLRFSVTPPYRTNLEYLNTLTLYPKAQVQLLSDVRKWAALRYERAYNLLHSLSFELT